MNLFGCEYIDRNRELFGSRVPGPRADQLIGERYRRMVHQEILPHHLALGDGHRGGRYKVSQPTHTDRVTTARDVRDHVISGLSTRGAETAGIQDDDGLRDRRTS